MPVTIRAWTHASEPIPQVDTSNSQHILKKACSEVTAKGFTGVIKSSFDETADLGHIQPANNGLIETVVKAYKLHYNLALRPDDIWFAILGQFACYVNKNSEELRDKFVSFPDKKTLVYDPDLDSTDLAEQNYADVATAMAELIQENVTDPELKDWMMPGFTTSTDKDKVVASIMMMGSMQKYFDYVYDPVTCGIPSITLLGERADYEKLLRKVDKLKQYGEEPTTFASLLVPVISRMILSFDKPKAKEVIEFWRTICYLDSDCAGTDYTGWITAFCFWYSDGRMLYYVSPTYKEMYYAKLEAIEKKAREQKDQQKTDEKYSIQSSDSSISSADDNVGETSYKQSAKMGSRPPVRNLLSTIGSLLFCRQKSRPSHEQPEHEKRGVFEPDPLSKVGDLFTGPILVIDDVFYASLKEELVPTGWLQVPLTIIILRKKTDAVMVAGLVGMGKRQDLIKGQDVLQPEVGWWVLKRVIPDNLPTW